MSGKEGYRSIELSPELVQAFAATFISRWDKYPLQLPDGTYAQIHKPLTYTHVFKHLTEYQAGRKPQTLGVHLLTQKVYPCVKLNGDPLAPTIRQQIALLGNPERVPLQVIEQVLAQVPAPEAKPVPSPPPSVLKKGEVRRVELLSETLKRA